MLRALTLALSFCIALSHPLLAATVSEIVAQNAASITKPSRQTIAPVIQALVESEDPLSNDFLQAWAEKRIGQRKSDDALFFLTPTADGYLLTDLDGISAGTGSKSEISEIKPNAGVRGLIATALVQFTLTDPDPLRRAAALDSVAADPTKDHLAPLRASLSDETDATLLDRKIRLERLLTLRYDPDTEARIAAIQSFAGDVSLDARAALTPILATTRVVANTPPNANIARELKLEQDISRSEAYALLVSEGRAPEPISLDAQKSALLQHIENGAVAGIPLSDLASPEARDRAYTALESQNRVPPAATADDIDQALSNLRVFDVYIEPDAAITNAARESMARIQQSVGALQAVDLGLDALSLASIYFLAAIGLAITFGVMGVINMAHGEFITLGAYTGYVVQLFIPDLTLSIAIALPLAFAVTFAAGVAMERLVIRYLYKRPLETLLATFGISIAIQQILKNIFGTQARPLTSPAWLDGALTLNDVVSISYIRIAIFVLALLFLSFFIWVMRYTRLGLEVRAVTQNPSMAASMGINPDRINMLTFGIGTGIAGIAGVAIGLFAKVTSELGSDYIVQSFMTVVVGGVGNIWGTLAGATMIGSVQKGIEWLNPSNTLAAQTYMILFIILFIQFRPRGIIALKGRAAGD